MEEGALENSLNFNLGFPSSSFVVNSDFLWLILSLVFLVFLVLSLILVFHWNKFGSHALAIGTAEAVYFFVSAFLILGAVASILLF